MSRRVVVLGPPDRFTSEIAARVAALPGADCVYGAAVENGVGQGAGWRTSMPCQAIGFDPDDNDSVRELLGPAFAVVNLYDVYPGVDRFIVPANCAALGVHYVDLCDSREYVSSFARLRHTAEKHDALLVTRADAVSVLTVILADMLAVEFDRVTELHVTITRGVHAARTGVDHRDVERMLQLARTKQSGRWRPEHWWNSADIVPFPASMGAHRTYGYDLPCLEDLLKRYEAHTAAARVAFRPSLRSLLLPPLALTLRMGWMRQPSAVRPLLRVAAGVTAESSAACGIRVAMRGKRGRKEDCYVASLVARNGSARAISWAPVVALVRHWLARGVREAGAVCCDGLLRLSDIAPELTGQDVILVRE